MSLVIWQARAMPQASLERENDARWWYTCQFRPLNPRQRQAEQRYGVRFDTRPYHPGYDHARYHGQVAEAELVSTRHGLISAHFGNAFFRMPVSIGRGNVLEIHITKASGRTGGKSLTTSLGPAVGVRILAPAFTLHDQQTVFKYDDASRFSRAGDFDIKATPGLLGIVTFPGQLK